VGGLRKWGKSTNKWGLKQNILNQEGISMTD
jgi:hypothetical protein